MTLPKPWISHEQVDHDLSHHAPDEVVAAVHDAVRQAHKALAHRMIELLPEGPAKTTAYNKIRETMMWANAAVAVQDNPLWRREIAPLAIRDEQGTRYPRLVLEGSGLPKQRIRLLPAEDAARLIFQALGTASMCWDNPGGAGVFRSEEAAALGRELLTALGYEVPANYRDEAAREAVAAPIGAPDELGVAVAPVVDLTDGEAGMMMPADTRVSDLPAGWNLEAEAAEAEDRREHGPTE